MRAVLTIVSVQSASFYRILTTVIRFCLAVAAAMRYNFKLEPVLCRFCHPTSQQDYILSSCC